MLHISWAQILNRYNWGYSTAIKCLNHCSNFVPEQQHYSSSMTVALHHHNITPSQWHSLLWIHSMACRENNVKILFLVLVNGHTFDEGTYSNTKFGQTAGFIHLHLFVCIQSEPRCYEEWGCWPHTLFLWLPPNYVYKNTKVVSIRVSAFTFTLDNPIRLCLWQTCRFCLNYLGV